jgi:hypothetical protein
VSSAVAKRHARNGRAAGQAGAPPIPPPAQAGIPPPAARSSASAPSRESAPDPVALLVAAVVLAAIALAAWLALFRGR